MSELNAQIWGAVNGKDIVGLRKLLHGAVVQDVNHKNENEVRVSCKT